MKTKKKTDKKKKYKDDPAKNVINVFGPFVGSTINQATSQQCAIWSE